MLLVGPYNSSSWDLQKDSPHIPEYCGPLLTTGNLHKRRVTILI
jgi:hypothetical protein